MIAASSHQEAAFFILVTTIITNYYKGVKLFGSKNKKLTKKVGFLL